MAEPREAIAEALSTYLTKEQVSTLIDEILAITKRVSAEFTCKACKQRQMVWTTIPDAKAVASALTDLANQAFGRPSEENRQTDPVAFYRLTSLEALQAVKREQREKGGGVA